MQLSIEPGTARATRHLLKVELCFQYSFLSRFGPDEDSLHELRALFEGDRGRRRRHRRHHTYLPAAISSDGEDRHGILLNFSASGLLLATPGKLEPGSSIRVLVGKAGRLEHLFTCRVLRSVPGLRWWASGCEFCAPPVEMRS